MEIDSNEVNHEMDYYDIISNEDFLNNYEAYFQTFSNNELLKVFLAMIQNFLKDSESKDFNNSKKLIDQITFLMEEGINPLTILQAKIKEIRAAREEVESQT